MDILSAFQIIFTGTLVAASCAMLGCFLILRKLAMLGDAISHSILLGIVIAFYVSHSAAAVMMVIGAVVVGVLTTYFVQLLSSSGVNEDAAMGVTFTSLFALGVVGVSTIGQGVHLDLDCVLYGEIAYTPFDPLLIGDANYGPKPIWVNGGLFLFNAFIITLFYKEYKLCTFDPALAASAGIPVLFFHYLLMSQVSLTVVGAFESVGVILVIAMMIAPAAAAYLLTDSLGWMLCYAVGIGCLSSITGYISASWFDCSIAGAMGVSAGICFFLAFLFSPSHGVIHRWLVQLQLRHQVMEEDALLWAGRRFELESANVFSLQDIKTGNQFSFQSTSSVIKRLLKQGVFHGREGGYELSGNGKKRFNELIKRHRVYETYLGELGYPEDHIHDPADRAEHHITPNLTAAIDQAIDHAGQDPQGKIIPRDQ